MEENLQKRVGFGPRLGAYLLDGLFIIIIMVIMGLLLVMGGAVGIQRKHELRERYGW